MVDSRIVKMETDLEALICDLQRQCLAIRRGLQDTQRTGAIFAAHPLATSLSDIQGLRKAFQMEEDPDLRDRFHRLYFGCLYQFLRMDLLMMDEMVNQFLVQAAVGIDGERISIAELVPWVLGQPDFEKREMLRSLVLPLLKKGSELKARLWMETLGILREDFGYPDYIAYCQEKKGVDLAASARRWRALLDATDALYRAHVPGWVERVLGRPLKGLSRYHAIYLLRLRGYDHAFPARDLMGSFLRTLESLGIEALVGRRLFVDLHGRPGKSPLARCVPIRIPNEVHVIMRPMGGLSDYETLFHEMGHGLHYVYTAEDLPYPYRHLPRSFALSECFGFLFQDLVFEPAWLSAFGGLGQEEIRLLRYEHILKLLCMVRRYIGKFLFEYELFSQKPWGEPSSYVRWLGYATGFLYETEGVFLDIEEEFYCLDYLEAWAGAAALRAHLQRAFGEEWFFCKASGVLLRELWRKGERWDLPAMLQYLGLDPQDLSSLIEVFQGLDELNPYT